MRPATRIAGPALGLLLAPAAWSVPLDSEGKLQASVLLQPRLELGFGDPPSLDPSLQRAWLGFAGQPTEQLSFSVVAGVEDFGRAGVWSADLRLREGWLEWNFGERLQVDAGLMVPPWAIHTLLREESRLAPGDHSGLFSFPNGTAGRDVGLQARGRLFNRHLEYRFAGLGGVGTGQGLAETDYDNDGVPDADPLSPDDLPRVTARLAWSFFTPLGGAGAQGFRPQEVVLQAREGAVISQRKVVTASVAIDHQQDSLYVEHRDHTGAVVSARRADYTALAGDILVEMPMRGGQRSLHALVAGFWYPLDEQHPQAGQSVLAEGGWRFGRVEPIGSYELHDAQNDLYNWMSWRLGLALWLPERGAALRLAGGASRQGGGRDLFGSAQLQAQLAF